MVGRTLIWSTTARICYEEVLAFYIVRNGSDTYSKKLHKKVTRQTKQLLKHPFLGKPVSDSVYREFVLGDFSVFYKVLDEEVFIALFWDNRRDPELLQTELKRFL